MPITLPPISSIPSLPPSAQTTILDALFEPSPAIHTLLLPLLSTPYPSYPSLISAAHSAFTFLMTTTSTPLLHQILGSHPRLGAPKVDSEQSAAEQAGLQQGGVETAEKLNKLNEEYEARFPGLRFVVFVNGRGREEIMENMVARIQRGDIREEEREVIQAMCDIANDRANKLLAAGEN